MSFRVVNRDNGQESDKLRGNVVLGRNSRQHDYEDRFTVEGVDVDEYSRVPGELYNNTISRNHLLVAENPDWVEETRMDSGAVELPQGQMGLDVWDLNSVAGTEVSGYDPETGHPIYQVGDTEIEVRPLNHYLGIAGPDDNYVEMQESFDNNIESLAENLESRGFETGTVTDATWDEVNDRLGKIENRTEEESNTFIMYTGHGSSSGKMALDDRRVRPDEFIDRVDDLDGEKVVVIDQCHAGQFTGYEIPDDITVYMASGPDDETQGNSIIEGERRTRYAGRVVQALESNRREVTMDDVHRDVASVSKVADNNPRKVGSGQDLSSVK